MKALDGKKKSTSKCSTGCNISASQAPEKQETAHVEESWSYDYDTYWTDDWSGYESYYGYDGDYSQGDWYWSYFASAEELTESEDKHSDVISEDGQTDKTNRFCFSGICLFRSFGHELVEALTMKVCGYTRCAVTMFGLECMLHFTLEFVSK